MAKLEYRSGRTLAGKPEPGAAQFSEFVAPLIILIVGLLMYGVAAMTMASARAAGVVMGLVFIEAVAEALIGIGVAYGLAALIGTSFGELRTAALKLAAILVFSGAVAWLVPMGWVLALFVYFGLILWLFGLEVYEAAIFAIVFSLVRIIVSIAVRGMLR